jgi:uncharacterized membrane protein
MTELVAAAAFFVAIHVFISGTALRGRFVARLGERGFFGFFSLLSAAGLGWLVWSYGRAPFVGIWTPAPALRPMVLLLVLAAFLLVVTGLTTPSPTAIGGEAELDRAEPAKGILRVTRHPFLWGVATWAFAHLLANGDAASLILFGSLLLLALVGPFSIDRKRARRLGDRWERFAAKTSNLPFAAIVAGRSSFALAEIGWWRIGLALILYAAFLFLHRPLFGVSVV